MRIKGKRLSIKAKRVILIDKNRGTLNKPERYHHNKTSAFNNNNINFRSSESIFVNPNFKDKLNSDEHSDTCDEEIKTINLASSHSSRNLNPFKSKSLVILNKEVNEPKITTLAEEKKGNEECTSCCKHCKTINDILSKSTDVISNIKVSNSYRHLCFSAYIKSLLQPAKSDKIIQTSSCDLFSNTLHKSVERKQLDERIYANAFLNHCVKSFDCNRPPDSSLNPFLSSKISINDIESAKTKINVESQTDGKACCSDNRCRGVNDNLTVDCSYKRSYNPFLLFDDLSFRKGILNESEIKEIESQKKKFNMFYLPDKSENERSPSIIKCINCDCTKLKTSSNTDAVWSCEKGFPNQKLHVNVIKDLQ